MGHSLGTPCIHENPGHEGGCSTPLPAGFVDLSVTRWFEVTETRGHLSYWRTNATAGRGSQVELRWSDGTFHTSRVFDTEQAFLRSIRGWSWREITSEEVPALSDVERFAIAQDIEFDRTYGDAADRYREDHQ